MAFPALSQAFPMDRRTVLTGIGASGVASLLPGPARADPPGPAIGPGQPFSFDLLTEAVRRRASAPDPGAQSIPLLLEELDYDGYRNVAYRPEAARWQEEGQLFQLHAFHRGWLFPDPVGLFQVEEGTAQLMTFNTRDFEYRGPMAERAPADTDLPAIAGFRLHHPLNRANRFDELVAFLGASYFRALGRGNAYGASARGLALNTATSQREEFPRFSAFYLEKPAIGGESMTFYAVLDSASVAGAYRFMITPGHETVIEITSRLFFRNSVEELGVAPLTSMYLYDEMSRSAFEDYRPQVHDSQGLQIRRANGAQLWRPLANPTRLANSYFFESSLRGFGLHQRDRAFHQYQDAEARYEKRPSMEVEPIGDWGQGYVRLVEIPSDLEINDNIVAYWVPETAVTAGDAREFSYRLRWGDLPADRLAALAYVSYSATGPGGVAGVPGETEDRKFVIDFEGGRLSDIDADAGLEAAVQVRGGTAKSVALSKVFGTGIWRLAFDVAAETDGVIELNARIEGYGQTLTETWAYQWVVT